MRGAKLAGALAALALWAQGAQAAEPPDVKGHWGKLAVATLAWAQGCQTPLAEADRADLRALGALGMAFPRIEALPADRDGMRAELRREPGKERLAGMEADWVQARELIATARALGSSDSALCKRVPGRVEQVLEQARRSGALDRARLAADLLGLGKAPGGK